MLLRQQHRDYACHLRHAVSLIEMAVELAHRASKKVGRYRAGRIIYHLKIAQIIIAALLGVEDAFENDGNNAYGVYLLGLESAHVVIDRKA